MTKINLYKNILNVRMTVNTSTNKMFLVSNCIEFGVFTFITILITAVFYLHRNHRYWKNKNVPFLKPIPLIGSISTVLTLRETLGELFASMYHQTTEPFIGFFIFYKPILLFRDPELIKQILISDFQYFCDRVTVVNKEHDPIGAHLLFLLQNPEWKEVRAKVTPLFTSSKIKIMSKLIEDSGNEMVTYLSELTKEDPVVEIKDFFQKFTVDVISSTAFGIKTNCFRNKNSQFKVVAEKLLDWSDLWVSMRIACYFFAPQIAKFFKMTMFDRDCMEFLKNRFHEVIDERKKSKIIRNDLVDILLQIQNQDHTFIENDKLISQAVAFFAAGFETTSSVLTFALFEIAKNFQVQEKLRDEITQILKKEGINYDSIKRMTYLEMCLKETLRKYPVIPFLDRICDSDYKIPGTEIIIEKGTTCLISTLGLHQDPKYYPNPKIFDPERFSKKNTNQMPNDIFFSFGVGPRDCIGKRFGKLIVNIALAHIIKNFTIQTCDQTQREIKFEPKGSLLAPLDGIKLKFQTIEQF